MDDRMSSKELIDKLIEISKNKYRYLNIILGIQKNLSIYIKEEKIQNILRQIDLNDRYMSKVQGFDRDFYSLFNKLKSNLGIDSIDKIDVKKYPQLKELKKIVVEILKLDEEIRIIENQNIKIIKKDKGEISNKLRGIKQGTNADKAYKTQKNLLKGTSFNKKK
ncbi:hypothetical protein [Paramaledivibacter caminithermalis]|nr:hypothetical protein [Paramaledivibacter caminithermalis]